MTIALFCTFVQLVTLSWAAINTKPASVKVVGQLNNPGMQRDSCNSAAISGLGILWTCRDTQPVTNGQAKLPIVTNTASWSNKPTSGNYLNLNTLALNMPYFPMSNAECGTNSAGECNNGTRWVGWPNTGPLVVYSYNGAISAYAWIPKYNFKGLTAMNQPYHSMYHLTYYSKQGKTLPSVALDTDVFWGPNDIGYGTYDTMLHGVWGYLFGQTPKGDMTVARVNLTDPLYAIHNRDLYEYWVNGAWSKTKPNKNQNNLGIKNAYAGGSGKFYWSQRWNSFVWVGGGSATGCTFYITTAPDVTGPWTTYAPFYPGCENGSGPYGGYTLLPHPDLGNADGSDLYLTWTISTESGLYENILAHVVWQ